MQDLGNFRKALLENLAAWFNDYGNFKMSGHTIAAAIRKHFLGEPETKFPKQPVSDIADLALINPELVAKFDEFDRAAQEHGYRANEGSNEEAAESELEYITAKRDLILAILNQPFLRTRSPYSPKTITMDK